MSEVSLSFLFALIILCVLIPVTFHMLRFWRQARRNSAVKKVCAYLFPGDNDGLLRARTVERMMAITNNRFTEDEMLDYYLKIKGLQMIDMNSFNDSSMRKYLMRPTQVRLEYSELVTFYEEFLGQSEAHGITVQGEF